MREDDAGRATVSGDLVSQDGAPQPVHFTRGEELRVRDDVRNQLLIRVVEFFDPAAVLEYRAAPASCPVSAAPSVKAWPVAASTQRLSA